EAVATYQIVLQLLAVVFMVALGMSSATAVLVSDAFGRRDGPGVTHASWAGLKLNSAAMVICALIMVAVAGPIARAFTAEPALEAPLRVLSPATAMIPLFDGIQVVGAAALRARSDNWFPTASHFLAYLAVMPPLAFFLGEVSGLGVHGLLSAILTASLLSAG